MDGEGHIRRREGWNKLKCTIVKKVKGERECPREKKKGREEFKFLVRGENGGEGEKREDGENDLENEEVIRCSCERGGGGREERRGRKRKESVKEE